MGGVYRVLNHGFEIKPQSMAYELPKRYKLMFPIVKYSRHCGSINDYVWWQYLVKKKQIYFNLSL